MEEKKTSQVEKVSRGEFFGIAAKKTKEAAFSWIEKILAPISYLTDEKTNETHQGTKEEGAHQWLLISNIDVVTQIPKMILKQGKGYFLMKDNNEIIKVIYGMCPEDGFVMNYLNNEDGLYCANCQAIYYIKRDSELIAGKSYAEEITSMVENNQIYISL